MPRIDWVRDEVILALDLFVEAGSLNGGPVPGKTDPRVIALSRLMNALPIHPLSDRNEKFRNPDGVGLKLANFRAVEREVRLDYGDEAAAALPEGMSRGSEMDRLVFEEFYQRGWDELHAEASAIRATAHEARPTHPADAIGATDAPVEGGDPTEYEASGGAGGVRNNTEARLVKRYADYMTARGHDVTGRRYRVTEEARRLRADLLVRSLNLLVEAKGNVERNSIRLGIGQVLDYRRYEDDPRPECALLLPQKPNAEMLELLASLDIGCIWPHGDGFTDSTGTRRFTK